MTHYHFVLVHDACHGAWSWYKLKHRLELAGHRVTALDLAASGTNTKSIHDVRTFCKYTQPLLELMASLGAHERVILVGHGLGGLNLALAADWLPDKISVAVFLAAFMPDTAHRPSYVLEEYSARVPEGGWLDTQFTSIQRLNNPLTSMFFGPKFLSSKLYQLSPPEDLELCKILMRPGPLFLEGTEHFEQLHQGRVWVDNTGLHHVHTRFGDAVGVPMVDDREQRGRLLRGGGRRGSHGHAFDATGALRLSVGDWGQMCTCLTLAVALGGLVLLDRL